MLRDQGTQRLHIIGSDLVAWTPVIDFVPGTHRLQSGTPARSPDAVVV